MSYSRTARRCTSTNPGRRTDGRGARIPGHRECAAQRPRAQPGARALRDGPGCPAWGRRPGTGFSWPAARASPSGSAGSTGRARRSLARHLCARARQRGFATSEVQISINDTPLHHLETVYRRLMERLETAADGPHAFQAVVEGWLYRVGDEVMRLRGITEDDPLLRRCHRATPGGQAGRPVASQSRLRAGPAGLPTGPPTRATSPPPRGCWPG